MLERRHARRSHVLLLAFGSFVFLLLLAAIIAEAGRYSPAAQLIGAISIVIAVAHAIAGLGWRDAVAFVAVCLGFFGFPLSNFVGWLLTTNAFFLLFSLNQYIRRDAPAMKARSRMFWIAAVLLYLASGLSHVLPFMFDQNLSLIDRSGRVWQSADLRETSVVVMTMTMLPSSLIAALRLYQPR